MKNSQKELNEIKLKYFTPLIQELRKVELILRGFEDRCDTAAHVTAANQAAKIHHVLSEALKVLNIINE